MCVGIPSVTNMSYIE